MRGSARRSAIVTARDAFRVPREQRPHGVQAVDLLASNYFPACLGLCGFALDAATCG